MLKAIDICICDGKGCVLFPVSLSFPSRVANSTMRILGVNHPHFDVGSCCTLLHTKSIRQLESIGVLCVLEWKNINLAVCLQSPACFMPLFACCFCLAAEVLCRHKHFSVVSCEQIQFEFFGWDIKSTKH